MWPMRAHSSRRWIEIVAASIVGCATLGEARADELSRVAVAGDEPELQRAVGVALSSWHVEVLGAPERDLGASLPAAATAAEALCTKYGVQAVVWISRTDAGRALWVYDTRSRELISRPVPEGPPFTGPVAASLALATKTLLKKSSVAPPPERFGAPPATPEPTAPPPPSPPPPAQVFLEGALGARLFGISTQVAEPRATLGLSFYPRSTGLFGFYLDASLGSGTTVETTNVDARVLTVASSLGARARFELGDRVALEPGVGLALDVVNLDATADRKSVHALRVNLGTKLAVVFDVRLGRRTWLGLVNSVTTSFRRQDYTYAGESVARGGFVTWDVSLRIRVGAD